MHPIAATSAAVLAFLPALGLCGQELPPDAPSPLHRDGPDILVTVKPGVWFTRAEGDVAMGSAGDLDFDDDLDLNDVESTLHVEGAIRVDRWEFGVNGFDFDTDSIAIARRPLVLGDLTVPRDGVVESSIDWSTFAIEAQYAFTPGPAEDPDVRFCVSPIAGLRRIDFEHVVSTPGGASETVESDLVAPYLGAGLDVTVWDEITLAARVTGGISLDGDEAFVTVGADLTWRPVENVGVTFGYREFDLGLDEKGAEVDARVAGLFLGVNVVF